MKHHPTREGLTIDTKAGPVWNGTVRFNEAALQQVLHWSKPRMIFWNAHGDMFHDSVPEEWIDRCFAVMALTPQHKHQVLTKRSARMREYMNDPLVAGRVQSVVDNWESEDDCPFKGHAPWVIDPWPLPNVWLGVSVEDQTRADERIPDLLATPAAVRWLSCEPLLGPVDLRHLTVKPEDPCWRTVDSLTGEHGHGSKFGFTLTGQKGEAIDWVVAGGESGPNARPMHPDWARSLRDQCAAAGVPFLFKQWGEWFPYGHIDADGHRNVRSRGEAPGLWHTWPGRTEDCFSCRIGKQQAGRLLDGVQHDGYPG